jgi:hypothetical protein
MDPRLLMHQRQGLKSSPQRLSTFQTLLTREDLPLIQQPFYDEVMKRVRAQQNTFTTVVKHWAKTKQDLFLPVLRKTGGCEMRWDKATEDLIRWIAEEAPAETSEKCGKLMQWRIPRMRTYVMKRSQRISRASFAM